MINIGGDILVTSSSSSFSCSSRWFSGGAVDSSSSVGENVIEGGLKTLGRLSSTERKKNGLVTQTFWLFLILHRI